MKDLTIADLKSGIDYSQDLIDKAVSKKDELDIQFFSELKEKLELELEIKLRELFYSL